MWLMSQYLLSEEIKELQMAQPILPLSPQTFDFGTTGNMANYFQTAALKSGQSAVRQTTSIAHGHDTAAAQMPHRN